MQFDRHAFLPLAVLLMVVAVAPTTTTGTDRDRGKSAVDTDLDINRALKNAVALVGSVNPVEQRIGLGKLELLAQAGSTEAMLHLADVHKFGKVTPKDFAAAERWYLKAARSGNKKAVQRLVGLGSSYRKGKKVPRDYASALRLYRAAADHGSAAANAHLGWMFSRGLGVKRDYAAAAAAYELGARGGVAWANNNLAWLYQNGGYGLAKNYERSFELTRQGARRKSSWAMGNLGWLYENGYGVEKDVEIAAVWYRKAADAGNDLARANLGNLYRNGWGVKRDYKRAFKLLRKAADAGNAYAMRRLGGMHARGQGVDRDDFEAARWFERAAERGDVASMISLADMHLTGFKLGPESTKRLNEHRTRLERRRSEPFTGSVDDYDEAIRAFAAELVATREKHERSQYNRPQKGVAWLRKAIEAGSDKARLRLANLLLQPGDLADENRDYRGGKSLLRDPAEAARLYAEGAAAGNVPAMFNLAALYELGIGVKKDLQKASDLYRQAASKEPHRAALALYRIEQEPAWRWQRVVRDDRTRIAHKHRASGIVITVLKEGNIGQGREVRILDEYGRRIFVAHLAKGQSVKVPAYDGRLILWLDNIQQSTEPTRDIISLSVDGNPVDFPETLRARSGIYLDRKLLTSGGDYIVNRGERDYSQPGPTFLPPDIRDKARVELRTVRSGKVHISDPGHLVGFGRFVENDARFQVPDIPDLTLEIWTEPQYAGHKLPALYDLYVDGKRITQARSVEGCIVVIALNPDRLKTVSNWQHAFEQSRCVQAIDDLDEGERIPVARDSAGRLVAWLQKPFKASISLPIMLQVNAYTNWLASRFDEALQLIADGERGALRYGGPSSSHYIYFERLAANIEISMGRIESARQRIEKVVQFEDLISGPAMETTAYLKYSELLREMGRLEEAEIFGLKALAHKEQRAALVGGLDRVDTSEEVRNLARLYLSLGNLEKATLYALRELLVSQVAKPEKSDELPFVQPRLLIAAGRYLQQSGNDALARHAFNVARQMALYDHDLHGKPEPVKHPIDFSYFEARLGPAESSGIIADGLAQFASAYDHLNRHAEAVPLLELSAKIRRNVFGDDHILVAETERLLARQALALGRPGDALKRAREAAAIARQVRKLRAHTDARGLGSDASPNAIAITYLDAIHAVYQSADDTAMLAQEAFEVAQVARDRLATKAIRNVAERFAHSDPGLRAIIRRRQNLVAQIESQDAQLLRMLSSRSAGRNAEQERRSRNRLKKLRGEISVVDEERKRRFPGYARFVDAEPVTGAQIREVLADDEALISYVLDDEASYMIVVRRERASLFKLAAGRQEIGRLVARIRETVDPLLVHALHTELRFDIEAAYALHQAIIAPAAAELAGVRRLNVISEGPLQSLPFELLVDRLPIDTDIDSPRAFETAHWLVKKYEIVATPSAEALYILRGSVAADTLPEPYAAFANPLLKGRDGKDRSAWQATSCQTASLPDSPGKIRGIAPDVEIATLYRGTQADVADVSRLEPLPDSTSEVCAVSERLGGRAQSLWLGQGATETTLKSLSARGDLARYRVLHFATHGLVAGELTGQSEPALVLTPPETATPHDDGLLTASEITQLQVKAQLVLLSACNTAAGQANSGAEGLSGLARAFFHAGARALLVSHWSISSAATVDLITRMFSEHAKGSFAAKLRAAQLDLISGAGGADRRHPIYWAPFSMVGG
ncbi:MAG: CHAT domain-containing protein [Alphaproteobacteria bacterium]|nr:CHAT domain-containing protein [Alphaproteobacteria bacterium]